MSAPEKLCIFCEHFRWSSAECEMGITQTGPMFSGGAATCAKGRYKDMDDAPSDEKDYRNIILRGENCGDYSQVKS